MGSNATHPEVARALALGLWHSRGVPSLAHQVLARAVPRIRGSRDLDTAELERARLETWHGGLDRSLPTGRMPGFDRRYEVTLADTPFPTHVIRPRGRRPRTTVYYLHGGGYVAPTDAAHVRYALRLARLLDAEVVIPDYPLAPEHTWRDSHRAIVEDLARRTAAQDRVVVAGDSAGGGIALAVTQSLRDRRAHLPSHLVLLSPWVDLTTSTPETYELDAIDPWLFIGKLDLYADWWAGGAADLGRPEVSPALGDLDGLPPTLMFCGTLDRRGPGGRLLADRAAASDWSLTYLEAADLIHVFPLLPVPEAKRAWRHTEAFLA
ncbi:N/A [soil metagenome]